MTKPTCRTCRFISPVKEPGSPEARHGYCHGAPPTVTGVATMADGRQTISSQFPLMDLEIGWCGLHQEQNTMRWWPR